jgi:putative membrane protein
LCIGVTGVLQGISGGSMALLLGVHHELVTSIRSFDRSAINLLRAREYGAWWQRINGNFLLALFAGVITGLLVLRAHFSDYFTRYPIFISSFFFSLVIIAALLLLRKITRWDPIVVAAVIIGAAVSYFFTRSAPLSTPNHLLWVPFAGFLAGSTLAAPGVSASFMLMFIGKYQYILTSFGSLEIDVIILFIAGGILGLALVARWVAALLSSYYNLTVALFAGLIIGSLNKVWPWREVLEYTTVQGKRIPTFDTSVLPWRYLQITGKDPQVIYAILMMALGVFMVVIIEKITARLKTRS